MKKINFNHSVIFFNLSILFSPLYFIFKFEPIIFCLFLILLIGISHGALDNIKGKKLFRLFKIKPMYLFYISYLIISILIIISWLIFPNLTLLLFLMVAAYHFGKEDTVFSFKGSFLMAEILFFFKGSSVIIAPLLFQRKKTYEIFETLNFKLFESSFFNDQTLIIFLILSFFSSMYLSNKRNIDFKSIVLMDYLSLILLNIFLTPLLAFTLYFCFLHSIRHSISLIFELDKSFSKGMKKFVVKAMPLTLITGIIFLFAIYFLNNFYMLDEAIYKVIFIGLASLTFPHILLEYLLEKNEKRS
tara:strand:+ start:1339 stop:2244 length:906 start_codon:yes stop_codon:yes gene_type:complete